MKSLVGLALVVVFPALASCGSVGAGARGATVPELGPLPPELEPIYALAPCSYRNSKRCLAPPAADGSDWVVESFGVAGPCGETVARELEVWAKRRRLKLLNSIVHARRVRQYYEPQVQSFFEVYYSVPDDGEDTAEVFVGLVASSEGLRSKVSRDFGTPGSILALMRNAALRCARDQN